MIRNLNLPYIFRKVMAHLASGHGLLKHRKMLERLAAAQLRIRPPEIELKICVVVQTQGDAERLSAHFRQSHDVCVICQGAAPPKIADFVWSLPEGCWPTQHAIAIALGVLSEFRDTKILYGDEWLVSTDGHIQDLLAKPSFDPLLAARDALFGGTAIVRKDIWPDATTTVMPTEIVHTPYPLAERQTPLKPVAKSTLYQSEERVSIIVPSRNSLPLITACLMSLLRRTKYENFEIIVVDNGSDDQRVFDLYASVAAQYPSFRTLFRPGPFNFAALVNAGAEVAEGHVCLLNNDIEVREADWLSSLHDTLGSSRSRVGIVGARLDYPTGALQHCGVGIGINEAADHPLRGIGSVKAFEKVRLAGEYAMSAVTAAAMLVHRDCWNALGGFDEARLPVAFNDVDFCLRAQQAGWLVAVNGRATLVHHESASRGGRVSHARAKQYLVEREFLQKRWGTRDFEDPYLSPHHSKYHREPRLKGLRTLPAARPGNRHGTSGVFRAQEEGSQ